MKLKRIICMALSLAAVACMFLVNDSVAWINTQTGTPVGQSIAVDKMFFEFEGTLGTPLDLDNDESTPNDKYILADQNLIVDNDGMITGKNHSTIPTEMRVLVTFDTLGVQDVEYTGSENDAMVVVFADGWSKGAEDNYFYHSFAAVSKANSVAGLSFTVLNGLFYNVGKEYANVQVGVTITIQAKQTNYVDWETIETIITAP